MPSLTRKKEMIERPVPLPRIKAIAAMSLNRIIGDEGQIPWHLPEDFKWFKQCTLGQIVVMGRKTLESIGKPLPGRETVLISRTASPGEYPGVTLLNDPARVASLPGEKQIWICGGAEIYDLLLPLCSELFLTVVKRKVRGDALFPDFEPLFGRPEVIRDHPEFIIYRFSATSDSGN